MVKAIVFGIAILLICFICYWFFGKNHEQVETSKINHHQQEATVVVKGGYSPNTVVLKARIPAKLHFDMQDSTICLSHVVFEKLGIDHDLTKQKITTIDIPTDQKGELDFACRMNMFHGKVVIK